MTLKRVLGAVLAVVMFGCAPEVAPRSVSSPQLTADQAQRLGLAHVEARGMVGGVSSADLKTVRAVDVDGLGEGHVRLSQTHQGVPVFGAEAVVHLRPDGTVKELTEALVTDITVDAKPTLTSEQAIDVAIGHGFAAGGRAALSAAPKADLQILRAGRSPQLTWRVQLASLESATPRMPVVFVNAHTGEVAWSYDNLQTAQDRRVYNLNHGTTLPGTLARSEGQAAIGETDVDTNYDRLGSTWSCYSALFGRDSFDNAGATLISSVHYSSNYVNAYWNGTQMVYGDGDNVNSRSLAISMDVTAHELTHAVTERSSGLIYSGESGGLNEAMSDIFGNICEWYRDNAGNTQGPTSANTWMVGEDIWLASPALRYMSDPARDGVSLDFWTSTAGNVDVHYSSGIANLAFYLLANGGTHPRGKSSTAVTGIGIHDAARIFYRVNTTYLTPSSKFSDARAATVKAAVDLFGAGSAQAVQAGNAWAAVGVLAPPNYVVIDTVSNLSGATGSTVNSSYATAGATAMKFVMTGGTGDADLYVRFGAPPTTSTYDCRPYTATNNETCEFNPAQSGTYYVMIRGYAAYAGTTLTVSAAQPQPTTELSCTDGIDNDGDGAVDCADSDCTGNAACRPSTEISCTDGVDNDGDGALDCADSDCTGNAACLPATEISCTDGIDNDADGALDCADADCAGNAACAAPARVIVNEILANEPGSATAGEFIEVVNVGGTAIDVSGWRLSDSTAVRHVFAAGTTLAPGKAVVVFAGASAIPAGLANAVASSTGTLSLNNGGDRVSLSNASAVEVDGFTYGSSLAAVDGVSMNRSPDASATGTFALHTTLATTSSSAGVRANGSAF